MSQWKEYKLKEVIEKFISENLKGIKFIPIHTSDEKVYTYHVSGGKIDIERIAKEIDCNMEEEDKGYSYRLLYLADEERKEALEASKVKEKPKVVVQQSVEEIEEAKPDSE